MGRAASLQNLCTIIRFVLLEWKLPKGVLEKLNEITRLYLKMKNKLFHKFQTHQEIKPQDIIYYKNNRDEVVSALEFQPIHFLKAMSEMENMDWNFSKNYIGFSDNKDTIFFRRLNETRWSVEVPIFEGDRWTGYNWYAYSNSQIISDMLRLFFEKISWFEMLLWEMRIGEE